MVTIRRALVASGLVMAVVATGCSKGAATSCVGRDLRAGDHCDHGVDRRGPATHVADGRRHADRLVDRHDGFVEQQRRHAEVPPGTRFARHRAPDASAEAKFIGSASGLPAADETVGPFGPGASSTFDQAAAFLDGCSDVSFDTDGQHISGTMGKMAFPAVGDQLAVRWRRSSTRPGPAVTIDVVLARQGDLGVLVSAVVLRYR